jgi:hypothetical protein
MPETRPTSLYVIAIFNLIIGTLGVIWDSASTVSLFAERQLAARYLDAKQQEDRAEMQKVLDQELPHLRAFNVVFYVAIPWLLTLMLLASGVGLIRLRAWGWWLALLYGCVGLMHKVATGMYNVVFLLPVYQELADTQNLGGVSIGRSIDAAPTAQTVMAIVMVVMPFVLAFYPMAVLVVLSRPQVTAAFRRQPPPLAVQPA